ncbi:MAG TPA: ROK family protein [Anaerolineales bacterium]
MSQHIAVDIGGTQLRAASYASDSLTPLKLARTSTRDPHLTPLERLQDLIASIWPEDKEVAAIGVAAPGPIDPYHGVIYAAPNIPGWNNMPLRQILEDSFHVPVVLGNDANLAALGEWQYGAGQGHHYLVFLTVSTGIGGGVIVDDRLLLGSRGLATELGHITVLPGGPLCGCGQSGHLEALASGTAIARWVREELARGMESTLPLHENLTGRMISQAAEKGDALARAALERAGTFIGIAVADFLHIFNPSVVIIGGGVARSGPLLMDPLAAAMKAHALNPQYYADLTLTTAALGDEAGLLGALALARTK